jgi:ankyrin repeat protein
LLVAGVLAAAPHSYPIAGGLAPAATRSAPVADAAMRGDLAAVRALLRDGADVNAAHGDGMTALHWAAERGEPEIAEVLLYAGANLDAVTRIGHYTPLHLAGKAGSAPLIEMLLAAGGEVDQRTTTGVTALHLAAASGSAAAVGLLLDRGAEIDAREPAWGQTPLIFAAARDRGEVIRVLLARGADAGITTRVVDLAFESALQSAARDRQREVLQAFPGGVDEPLTPRQVQTAILAARELYLSGELPEKEGDADEYEDGDEPPSPNDTKGGLTALLHAARQGNLDAVLALLDGGADVDQFSAGDATTPLLMASINGQFDLAMLLLERGADPNLAARTNGATPLWATVNAQWQPRTRFPQPQEMGLQQASYLDLMDALLKAGADPNARLTVHPWYMVYSGCGNRNCGLADTQGSTAFWRAAYATDLEAMKLLVRYGADPEIATAAPGPRRARRPERPGGPGEEPRLRQPADFSGKERPEISLARFNRPDAADARGTGDRPEADADEDELDPSGLPPVPEGGPGVLPLHAAAGVGYGEGFAGNAHRHAPDGWMPAVKYLIEDLGADVNARDHNGYTPLHHAAARGDNEMILYLISKGADVTAVSRRGQTTADMANGPVQRVSPFPDTVALLEKLGSKNNHNCVSC